MHFFDFLRILFFRVLNLSLILDICKLSRKQFVFDCSEIVFPVLSVVHVLVMTMEVIAAFKC